VAYRWVTRDSQQFRDNTTLEVRSIHCRMDDLLFTRAEETELTTSGIISVCLSCRLA
jgi:hypothetical protein